MPVVVQECKDMALTVDEVVELWQAVRHNRQFPDDEVTVRCVSVAESQRLNVTYRQKDSPTNVLTFSYGDGTHDVALCGAVAQAEATDRQFSLRDYTALLLVHAFLHVTGMDHERDESEAKQTRQLEQTILAATGFSSVNL